MKELTAGNLLQGGKYRIEKALGQGGFGITYLAEQTSLGRKVCIKEFFMKDYGERVSASKSEADATVLTSVAAVTSAAAEIMGRYREKFIKEAKTIARLDHPGIVRIHDVFEENGTAYYVMDYIDGENLNDLVKREGALPESRALGYIRQVADALSYVHDHRIMHLDVKPANILVRKSDDKAILIDFGAAKQYDSEGTQTSTTPVGLSVGYAPIEMTKPGGVQTFSPETDVYSLGATLYFLVAGKNPPDASERMEMVLEGERFIFPNAVSDITAEVIEQSMQTRRKRTHTVAGFIDSLPALDLGTLGIVSPTHCPNCGENLSSSAKFCPNCGTRIEPMQDSAEGKIGDGRIQLDNKQFDKPETLDKKNQPKALENDHEWVDLGLSVKWSTCNVGADSPEQYGDLFAYGEIHPKAYYGEDNYVFYQKILLGGLFLGGFEELKYCSGDGRATLEFSDDAARANWGKLWRMPTWEECNELLENAGIEWTEIGGVSVCIFTSKINGNSIVFPAAGMSNNDRGKSFYIWSRSLSDLSFNPFCISGLRNFIPGGSVIRKHMGLSIRPVMD